MKKIILVLLAIIGTFQLFAQDRNYGKFDFEIGVDVPVVAPKMAGYTNSTIPFLYLEGRWQLEKQPIDVGFNLGVSGIKRTEKGRSSHDNYNPGRLLVIADWQFGRGERFNPYVGLGTGICFNNQVLSGVRKTAVAFSPRVGVRCFKFMNVSIGCLLTQKYYSHLYANLGFYF